MTESIKPENEIIVKINNAMTPMDCDIPDDIELEEAVLWANYLGNMYKQSMWALGALLTKSEQKFGEMYSHVMEATGLDYGTLRNVKYVYSKIQLSLRNDKVSWSHYLQLASMEPVYQKKWVDLVLENKLSVKQLREAIHTEKASRKKSDSVPRETYEIIYANPPREMGLKQLCEMPIENLASETALLFIWAQSPELDETLRIIKAWGFEFADQFAWEKNCPVENDFLIVDHEILMIAQRGDFQPISSTLKPSSFNKCTESYDKNDPQGIEYDLVYETIDQMFPDKTIFNLFGNIEREGWKSLKE